jgi:hypothetical protein
MMVLLSFKVLKTVSLDFADKLGRLFSWLFGGKECFQLCNSNEGDVLGLNNYCY